MTDRGLKVFESRSSRLRLKLNPSVALHARVQFRTQLRQQHSKQDRQDRFQTGPRPHLSVDRGRRTPNRVQETYVSKPTGVYRPGLPIARVARGAKLWTPGAGFLLPGAKLWTLVS